MCLCVHTSKTQHSRGPHCILPHLQLRCWGQSPGEHTASLGYVICRQSAVGSSLGWAHTPQSQGGAPNDEPFQLPSIVFLAVAPHLHPQLCGPGRPGLCCFPQEAPLTMSSTLASLSWLPLLCLLTCAPVPIHCPTLPVLECSLRLRVAFPRAELEFSPFCLFSSGSKLRARDPTLTALPNPRRQLEIPIWRALRQ